MHRATSLLALLLLLPAVAATQISEDGEGDATLVIEGQAVPTDRASQGDLVDLVVTETEETVVFDLGHGAMADPGVPLVENQEFWIHFRHGGAGYAIAVTMGRPIAIPEGIWSATLFAVSESGGTDFLGSLARPTVGDQRFQVEVGHQRLLDEHGVPLQSGRALEDFQVHSKGQSFINIIVDGQTSIYVSTLSYEDTMPDEGTSPVPFESTLGPLQEGDLNLGAQTPLRWSNGEATAFAYEVVVQNSGERAMDVAFEAVDVPEGWTVVSPDAVRMEAGQQTVDVVAHVPFQHSHGDAAVFLLEARGDDGVSVGRIELGVHYPAIPQPTGHHSTLWLHSRPQEDFLLIDVLETALGRPSDAVLFMNAAPEDDRDEGVPVPGQMSELDFDEDTDLPIHAYRWTAHLSPGLRMGLDMDLAGRGTLEAQFTSQVDLGNAWLQGRIFVADPAEREDFSNAVPGTTMAVLESERTAAGSGATLTAVLVPHEDGDLVPFEAGQQLYLDLFLFSDRPDVFLGPNLGVDLLEGSLTLPLREYHDSIAVPLTVPQKQLVEETAPEPEGATGEVGNQDAPLPVTVSLAALAAALWAARRRD